jgi:hypothetical protein
MKSYNEADSPQRNWKRKHSLYYLCGGNLTKIRYDRYGNI